MAVKHMDNYNIEGLYTDTKPTWRTESSANGYLPAGARFYELDTKKTFTFDGAGTWYPGHVQQDVHCYADTRTAIAINTSATERFLGTAFTKSGEKLVQWVVETADAVTDPTRTFYIYRGTTNTVYFTSTACTDNVTAVRTLGTTEGPYFDGTYGILWRLSVCTTSITVSDYYTLYWAR